MSLRDVRKHAGQLAIAGFAGLSIPPELKALAREFDLGGVIFFARNVESPEQVAELSRQAQELAGELPLWVSVDQEGGRVARLKAPFTEWPPMMTLGRSADETLTRRFARALATELTAVGISLDYTPVLDIHTNPKNPVIGDRALAENAADVARLGRVLIETLQENGIAACGKHFPGHGDTLGGDAVPARRLAALRGRARSPPRAAWTSTCSSSLLVVAAILGNSVNYAIGRWLGKPLLHRPRLAVARIPKHLEQGRTRSTSATAARRW